MRVGSSGGIDKARQGRPVKYRLSKMLLLAAAACGAASAEVTGPGASRIQAGLLEQIRGYLATDMVQLSVADQNARHKDRTPADIETLDNQWRRETTAKSKPLIAATLSSPLSAYLTRIQAHSGGLFSEIFVMDDKGLNVGQSSISSDYWQGDEAKWQKTYLVGAGTVFIDEPEYDPDLKVWFVQVNMSVDDVATNKVIGAATFQVNLTEMQRRR